MTVNGISTGPVNTLDLTVPKTNVKNATIQTVTAGAINEKKKKIKF